MFVFDFGGNSAVFGTDLRAYNERARGLSDRYSGTHMAQRVRGTRKSKEDTEMGCICQNNMARLLKGTDWDAGYE